MARAQNQDSQNTAADQGNGKGSGKAGEAPAKSAAKADGARPVAAAASELPAAASTVPAAASTVIAAPAKPGGRNVVKLDIPRSAVKQIKVVDTDLVLILEDGRTVYVRDGAVQAMVDQDFAVQFSDSVESSGQDLLHSAASADLGRIAITGTTGEAAPGTVTTEAPAAPGAAPAPAPHSAPKWQSYALIGAPLIGGLLGGVLGGGSSGASSTPSTSSSGLKTATPVISPVNGNGVVNKAAKDAGVTIKGTAEANATVTVLFGTTSKTATADASGNWSVQYSGTEIPADADQVSISATAKTATASVSDPASRDVRVDTTPPVAPVIDKVTGDNLINPTEQQGAVLVSGRSEAGATVSVQWGTTTKLVVANAAGVWVTSFAVGEYPSAVGASTLTATATDTAGNSGAQASQTVTISPQVDVVGFVAAGRLVSGNGLVVSIYAADGKTLLASNVKVASNGSFSANGLAAAAGDAIIAVVSDTNDAADFLDEATGLAKNLGAARLLATGIVPGSGSLTLNINPLTTMAAQLAGVGEDGSGSVSAAKVQAANLAIAKALGLGETDISQITPITTNGGQYDLTNGASLGEKAGSLLAAMSGADLLNGGSVSQTISAVLAQLANGTFSAEGQKLLMEGAIKAAAQANPGLQGVVAELLGQSTAPTQFTIGTVAGDNIINASEVSGLRISGTVIGGATGVVLHIGTLTVAATINGTEWFYDVQPADLAALGAGVTVLSAQASFSGGGSATASRPIAVFTAAPITPTISPVSGDGYINAKEAGQGLTISGTGAVGNKITLSWQKTGKTIDTTVGTDGTWRFVYVAADIPQDADNQVTVIATDQFGNVSQTVAAPVHYDVIAPDHPLFAANTPTKIGIAAATQGVTFSGTGTAGDFVALTFGTYTAQPVKIGANGQWQVFISGTNLPADGVQTLSVKEYDLAGNASDPMEMQVTVAATRPIAPKFTLVANDSPAGTAYVNAAEAAKGFTVKGTGDPGKTVYVRLGSFTPSTTIRDDGTWSITFQAGNAKAGVMNDSTTPYVVTAWIDDGVGGVSDITTGPNVIFDTQINPPVIALPNGAADQTLLIGAQARATSYKLTGTCDTDVSKVVVTFTNTSNANITHTYKGLKTADGWSATILPTDLLEEGSWTVKVTTTDLAGNSAESSTVLAQVDTTAPGLPTTDATFITNGQIVTKAQRDAGIQIAGTAEALSKVAINWYLVTPAGPVFKNQVLLDANADGTWIHTLSGTDFPSIGGAYEIHLTATDKFGNTSDERVYNNIVLSGLSKPTPLITQIIPDDPALTVPDGYLNGPAVTKPIKVKGTAGASQFGAKVTVTWGGVTDTPGLPHAEGYVDSAGNWEVTFAYGSLTLGEGTVSVYAKLTDDTTGDYSTEGTKSIKVDTVLNQPVFGEINGVLPGANVTINYTSLNSLVVKATGIDSTDATLTKVVLYKGTTKITDTSLTLVNGVWSAQFTNLLSSLSQVLGLPTDNLSAFNGTDYRFEIQVSDAAGNTRSVSKNAAFDIDAPTLTFGDAYAPKAVAGEAGAYYLNSTNVITSGATKQLKLSGKFAGAQTTVNIKLLLSDGTTYATGTTTADNDGNWTLTTTSFAAALLNDDVTVSRQLIVTLTDPANNSSGPQAVKVYVDAAISAPQVASVDTQTTTLPGIGSDPAYYYVNKAVQGTGSTIKLAANPDYARVTLSYNGTTWDAIKANGVWQVTLPGNTWPTDGLKSLTLTAYDLAGNSATSAVPLWFDTAAPVAGAGFNAVSFGGAALLADPTEPARVWVQTPATNNGKAQFTVSGSLLVSQQGELGGFVRLIFTSTTNAAKVFTFDSARQTNATNNAWSTTVTLDDGTYTLQYAFYDEAMNTGGLVTYNVLGGPGIIGVDHLKPGAPTADPVTVPPGGVPYAWRDGTHSLSFTVHGDAFAKVSLTIGTKVFANVGTTDAYGNLTFTISGTDFPDVPAGGVTTLTTQVQFTDRAGWTSPLAPGPSIDFIGAAGAVVITSAVTPNNVIGSAERGQALTLSGTSTAGATALTVKLHNKAWTDNSQDILGTVTTVPFNATTDAWSAAFTPAQLAGLANGDWQVLVAATYISGQSTANKDFTVFADLTPTFTSAAHANFTFSSYDIANGFAFAGTGTRTGDTVIVRLMQVGVNGDKNIAQQTVAVQMVNGQYVFTGSFTASQFASFIPSVSAQYYLSVVESSTTPEINQSPWTNQTFAYVASNPTASQITVYSDAARTTELTSGTLLIGQTVYLRLELNEAVQTKLAGAGTITVKLNTGVSVLFTLETNGSKYLYASYTVVQGQTDTALWGVDSTTALVIANLTSLLDVDMTSTTPPTFRTGVTIKVDANRTTTLDAVQPLLLPATATAGAGTAAVTTADPGARFQIDYAALAGKTFTVGDTIQIMTQAGTIYASLRITAAMLSGIDATTQVGTWAGPNGQALVLTAFKGLPSGTTELVMRVKDDAGNITPLGGLKPLNVTVAPAAPRDSVKPVLDFNAADQGSLDSLKAGLVKQVTTAVFAASAVSLADTGLSTDSAGTAGSGIGSITLSVSGLTGLTKQLLSLANVTGMTLNGSTKTDTTTAATATATWSTDGSDIGAGKLVFALNGQTWQLTYNAASKIFSFVPLDALGQPTTTSAGQAQALVQALQYYDPNLVNFDGARRFTFTAYDGAGNASAAATANLVMDTARPTLVSAAAVVAKNGTITGFRLVFSEAVQTTAAIAALRAAGFGANASVQALNSFTLDTAAQSYASTFVITPDAATLAALIPGTLNGTDANGNYLINGSQITIAAGALLGAGGAADTNAAAITFYLPNVSTYQANTASYNSLLTLNNGAGQENGVLPYNFINASEKAAGTGFRGPSMPTGTTVHYYLNGLEFNTRQADGSSGLSSYAFSNLLSGNISGAVLASNNVLGRDGVKIYAARAEEANGDLGPWIDGRKAILDTVAPTVANATFAAGTTPSLGAGKTITIQFSEPVNLSNLNSAQFSGATPVGGFQDLTGGYNSGTTTGGVLTGFYATSWTLTLATTLLTSGGNWTIGTITDQAGNSTANASYNPPADLLTRPTSVTIGNVTADNVINSAESKGAVSVSVNVTNAKVGETVKLYRDGVQIGGDYTIKAADLSGTTATVSLSVGAGQWGGDGEHALTATVQDAGLLGSSVVSSPFRSVYVAANSSHWSQTVDKTVWFDPDTLTGADGAAINSWSGFNWNNNNSSALGPGIVTGTNAPILTRDATGHLRLYYSGNGNANMLFNYYQISTGWRPDASTGFALFSEFAQTGNSGGVLTTFVQGPKTGANSGLALVWIGSVGNPLTAPRLSQVSYNTQWSATQQIGQMVNWNIWTTLALTSDGTNLNFLSDDVARAAKLVSDMANYNNNNSVPLSNFMVIGGTAFQGLVSDQIMFGNKITQALNDEVSTYLAVKYQSIGTPMPVTALSQFYDLTVNAPQVGGYPMIVDDILQLGQAPVADGVGLGSGNDTIVTAGPDYVNAGAGNDLVRTTDLRFRVLDGGIGFDTLALDSTYDNAVSGSLFNLSDYVSNARGMSGVAADDARVNANGFHKLQGFEKLDFSLAPQSQTVKLTWTDVDQLADHVIDYSVANPVTTNATLYLALGNNDWLNPTGLGTSTAGYWLDPQGTAYSRSYAGTVGGDTTRLYVRGGAAAVGVAGALDSVVRDSAGVSLQLDQLVTLTGGSAADWTVSGGSVSGYSVSGTTLSTLRVSGTGLDAGVLTLRYTGSAIANSLGLGLGYTTFALGTDNADTINQSTSNGGVAIMGGRGDDVLTGSNFNDLFVTGTGNSTMTGGAGADTFSIGQNDSGRDTITDFHIREGDRIDLRSLLANAPVGGLFNSDGSFNTANGNLKLSGVAGTKDAILWVDTAGYGNVDSATTPYSVLLQDISVNNFAAGSSNTLTLYDSNGVAQTRSLAQLIQDQVVLVA